MTDRPENAAITDGKGRDRIAAPPEVEQGGVTASVVRQALGWMIVSCLMFALVMVSIRLFMTGLPPEQTVFLRYLFGVLLFLPFIGRRVFAIATSPVRGAMFLRAFLHGVGVYTWFYGVLRIPLAEVNAMLNLGPVYATIGAALFMGERLRIRRIAAILISFMGALIIIKPGFVEISLGTLAILFTAPLFAASDLIAKRLKDVHDDWLIIFALSFGIAVFLAIPAIAVWQPMTLTHWFGILVIGLSATAGHITLMRSFRGPMWAAQTGKYMQLLFVVLFGIFLFDEIPAISTMVGAMIVLAAVSYIAVREGRARRSNGV